MSDNRYKVTVLEVPPTEMVMFRVLQWVGVKGHDEAKLIYKYIEENAPCVLIEGISLDKAKELKEGIDGGCGKCEIEKADCPSPMLLWPSGNQTYEQGFFNSVRMKKVKR